MAQTIKKQLLKLYNNPYYWLVIGVGIFWVSTLLACAFRFSLLEQATLQSVNNLPNWLYGPFLVITQLGSGWVLLLLPIFLWLKSKGRLELQIVLCGVLAYILVGGAKNLVLRPRPEFLSGRIYVRELAAPGMGFPSGHTALATAVSLTLLPLLPGRWKLLVPLWIISVMVSRLYLGVHAPLDLVGGFGVGLFAAGLAQLIFKLTSFNKLAKG